ncbi:MAG: phage tail protein [Micavibrio aeruginosavorus]|uniref:Phage tail protein n=1 Tax=Micavibrio aeruginosavorus TaxID=349221 RepID=A0A2W5MYD7_9BACT|nr:MAG: phage tail protein [Micavibrio aeruginosavorus]
MISFNLIPGNIRVPGNYIEVDPSKAFRGLSGLPTKLLVIGQKLAAGTAAENVAIPMTRADDAKTAFGTGSMLANTISKILAANQYLEVYAIPQLDNAAGTAATGSIAFSGAPTQAGTQNIYIGGQQVQISVLTTDTPATLATKLVAAIAALPDLLVTSVVDGVVVGKVNLTFKHKGENGNFLDLRANYHTDQTTPSGLTIAFTAMSGGAGNPNVSAVIAAIGDTWWTDITMAYTDVSNITAMEAELSRRFGPLAQIDGYCYIGYSDTHSGLVTKGSARNSPYMVSAGLKKSPTPPWEVAAVLATQCAYFGNIDPARPFQTLPMPGVLAPAKNDLFTLQERNIQLYNGISTFKVDAGGNLLIERTITNYRVSASGATDPSMLDINIMKTITYLRYDSRNYIALRYPRHKLANDGTAFSKGQAVVTPMVVRAALINRFKQWEGQGLVEDLAQFKEDLIVERDENDNDRLNALIPPNIVNGFRVFAGLFQHRL